MGARADPGRLGGLARDRDDPGDASTSSSSLSGGPLVAQIIVLTMPAASHLAIHFRDDRRREADPRVAARDDPAGRLGADPLVRDHRRDRLRGPGHQRRRADPAVRRDPGRLHADRGPARDGHLADRDAPAVPARGARPVRLRARWVGGAMNRLTGWVDRHPRPIVVGVVAVVAAGRRRDDPARSTSRTTSTPSSPRRRVVRDYHAVESRLGGIGLVELIVPVGNDDRRGRCSSKFRRGRAGARRRSGCDGRPAVAHVLSLATVLDPDGRLAALPPEAAARILAAKLDLIAASPQAELLEGLLEPARRGEARMLVRLVGAAARPRQGGDLRAGRRRRRRRAFGPASYLTGLSYLMTKTTEAIIVTQWSTFLWSAVGHPADAHDRAPRARSWPCWRSCRRCWRSAWCSA